ncbi:MAG: EamA family transporter [Candidatus Eisenbacteria bacterium]
MGMNEIGVMSLGNLWPTLLRCATHPKILLGFTGFGIGAIFWLAVISQADLSWAYPMLSLGYVLVLLISAFILREHVTMVRWLGALVICLGVYLVFRS